MLELFVKVWCVFAYVQGFFEFERERVLALSRLVRQVRMYFSVIIYVCYPHLLIMLILNPVTQSNIVYK